ncbi:MAG: hypothetical protein HZA19_00450 [Nitrospirae bacterium]|nr:hypothetical protein [Nitrospirota bacterium]
MGIPLTLSALNSIADPSQAVFGDGTTYESLSLESKREVNSASRELLKVVLYAQHGKPLRLKALLKDVRQVRDDGDDAEEKRSFVKSLEERNIEIPAFLKVPDSILSYGVGTYAGERLMILLGSIDAASHFLFGEIPWGKIADCPECRRFFFRDHHRKKFCSSVCRINQKGRKEYQKIRRQWERLVDKGLSSDAAIRQMKDDPRYGPIMQEGKLERKMRSWEY